MGTNLFFFFTESTRFWECNVARGKPNLFNLLTEPLASGTYTGRSLEQWYLNKHNINVCVHGCMHVNVWCTSFTASPSCYRDSEKKSMPATSSSFRELPPDNNEIKFSCLEKNGLIRFLHKAQLIGLISCK